MTVDIRKIDSITHADRRSTRYFPRLSFVNLNEKRREFVDQARSIESVTETDENETRVMIAYQEAVIGSAFDGVIEPLSRMNAPSADHIRLKNPPQNHRNLFRKSE